MVATLSGAGPAAVGQMAEQWTAYELRRLKRRGWRLINHVHFRLWDIDHVLLGPGGVVVVETKFSSDGWAPSRYTDRVISDAVERVQRNANDIGLVLGKASLPSHLVSPVVVLWGRSDIYRVDCREGVVRVISGHLLRDWLRSVPDTGLEDLTASNLYDKLAGLVQQRDQHDLAANGEPAKPLLLPSRCYVEWSWSDSLPAGRK